jgi:GMP synthase-like glutamine amidotransferase
LAGKASVTGICFGAQLLAHVIAGPEATGEHPDGMQAGLYELRAEQPDAVSSFHYHRIRREVILAAGAEVTLDSDRTEVQAFRFGDNVRGVQFHPELSPTALWRTLRAYRDVLDRHGVGAAPVESSIRSRRASWSERPWFEFVERPAGDAQLSAA